MKKIVLTGGGTAGHVTPNIALIDRLKEEGFEIAYIGSKTGIEKELIEKLGITYYGISSGKLRRYFSMKNFTDPFRVQHGYHEAKKILKELKPSVVFSKGGFVSVPVVIAAGKAKIPTVIHESDMTPGLANKLSIRYATKVCCNFAETLSHVKGKGIHTGTPIRKELFTGTREAGLAYAGFDGSKSVILVVGGSTGAVRVNEAVRAALPKLLPEFDILHLCGKGKMDTSVQMEGYEQREYCDREMKDVLAMADLVISRAGANAICELLALHKPNLLIPLSAEASRGDQILNAESFEKQDFSMVLQESETTPEVLTEAVKELYRNRQRYIDAMAASPTSDATEIIVGLLKSLSAEEEIEDGPNTADD
ncbi:MAG: undecaprenyldiphospho-muramoylpentapeptide beta-N-acetylglucosaminyltransferase [Lachnospiraceae bacterium]|nr:undecaprenyldiphospho-muramoylpentapeptide beta-N-acetylglucosaminyltransferase [Lachnospiraceae bacterium]